MAEDKKNCKHLVESLNQCLNEMNDKKCTELITQWYQFKCDLNYNKYHLCMDPDILIQLMKK